MSPFKKKSSSASDKKNIVIAILAVLLMISLIFNLILLNRLLASRKTITAQKQILVNVQEPVDHQSEVAGKWYGLCAKNVVNSVEDFYRVVHEDPVLAVHFADFDWNNARMGKLENSLWTHIAYRKNDHISTTRKMIILPKGDGYITDGKRWVRTFCCNDYVAAPNPFNDRVDSPTPPPPGPPEVPEPGTILLFGTGMIGIGLAGIYRRRKK
jgi:hypothetical protein